MLVEIKVKKITEYVKRENNLFYTIPMLFRMKNVHLPGLSITAIAVSSRVREGQILDRQSIGVMK